ncbi:MAG: hypothetical protein HZA94_00265 [Candidatus Vogelbacteria bacterium]|nr:hypothetical protein [Candidatus Vogelbacteria bacterium]
MVSKKVIKKILVLDTKYGPYKCIFETEKDMGGFLVEAQGLSGAISWGKTIREARLMIVEAIEGAIEANIVAGAEKSGLVQIKDNRRYVLTA